MENRKSITLFTRVQIALLVGGILAVVYLLVPRRSDIAWLKLSGNQVESLQLTREGLDPRTFSDEPKLVRQWIALLREDGRTREALDFARKLVALRPKNKLYGAILLQALEDENETVEAASLRLRMLRNGSLPADRKADRLDYLRVAMAFKWRGEDGRYVEAIEAIVEKGLYQRDDLEALWQAYSSEALFARAEGLRRIEALQARAQADGKLTPALHETLSALYASLGQENESLRHAAIAAGLPEPAAREFAAASESSAAAAPHAAWSASLSALNPHQIEALIDVAQAHNRARLVPPLYEALRARGALSFTRYFDYIDSSLKQKRAAEALDLAREIPHRLNLDQTQWFQLAQMLSQLGQRDQSIRIMQQLLSRNRPVSGPPATTSKRPGPRG